MGYITTAISSILLSIGAAIVLSILALIVAGFADIFVLNGRISRWLTKDKV